MIQDKNIIRGISEASVFTFFLITLIISFTIKSLKGGVFENFKMIAEENAESGLCPLYSNCVTGRVLPRKSCTRYKCNTFYGIDTLALFKIADDMMRKSIENRGIENGHIEDPKLLQMIAERSRGTIDVSRGVRLEDLNGYNGYRKKSYKQTQKSMDYA